MMSETPATPHEESTYTLLVIWGVAASLAAVLFAGAAVCFFLRARSLSNEQNPNGEAASLAGPETTFPGRYRLIEGEQQIGVVTLYSDHTFANEEGKKRPNYRWGFESDVLVIHWLQATAYLTNTGARGVYAGVFVNTRKKDLPVRLEKDE